MSVDPSETIDFSPTPVGPPPTTEQLNRLRSVLGIAPLLLDNIPVDGTTAGAIGDTAHAYATASPWALIARLSDNSQPAVAMYRDPEEGYYTDGDTSAVYYDDPSGRWLTELDDTVYRSPAVASSVHPTTLTFTEYFLNPEDPATVYPVVTRHPSVPFICVQATPSRWQRVADSDTISISSAQIADAAADGGASVVVLRGGSGEVTAGESGFTPKTSLTTDVTRLVEYITPQGGSITLAFTYTNPNARVYTFPNVSGTVVLQGNALTSLTVGNGTTMSKIRVNTTTPMTDGSVTVTDVTVTASSHIFPSIKAPGGGTVGAVYFFSKTPGEGYTIKSTSGTDTSVLSVLIIDP